MPKTPWHVWQTRDGRRTGTQNNWQFWVISYEWSKKQNYPPHVWRKQLILECTQPLFFTNSLTEDSTSTPQVGTIITLYRQGTGGSERLPPAPAVTQMGRVKSQNMTQAVCSQGPSCSTRYPSGWRWHFRTFKIRTVWPKFDSDITDE